MVFPLLYDDPTFRKPPTILVIIENFSCFSDSSSLEVANLNRHNDHRFIVALILNDFRENLYKKVH